MVAEHGRQEHICQRILGVVVAHRDLFEYDVAFQFDVVASAAAVEHHIGNQVDGQFEVLVEHVRVVAGVLLGGERIELTAYGVHGLRDVDGGARRCRLEQQVLEEMRGAGHGRTLVTRAHVDPDPDRGRPH